MSDPYRRLETDREDLLREATALVERAELTVPDFAEPIVVGFRNSGAASLFFGPELVYQFNTVQALRRAFRDGLLYKADAGQLIALRRERTPTEVALIRSPLSDEQTVEFLSEMHSNLGRLRRALDSGNFKLSAEVPAGANVVVRVRNWLHILPGSITIADSPRL